MSFVHAMKLWLHDSYCQCQCRLTALTRSTTARIGVMTILLARENAIRAHGGSAARGSLDVDTAKAGSIFGTQIPHLP
eukprot:2696916-Prymnesium_polylepis.1